MGLGQIYHRGVMARRFKITYRTKGGHSWVDYGAPSAVHELARLVSRLTELRLSESPRTTWNAGLIEGGASVNTIASEASVQVDLRSDDEAALAALADDVTWAARSIPRDGVDVSVELIGERFKGSIPEDHPLVRLAFDSLSAVEVEPRLSAGSTDASIPLHHGLPAVCIGLTTGSGSHSVDEYISIPPLAQGMEQLVRIASGAEHALNPRSGSASPPDKIPP
jgi:acetylornithine deacetylase/succinyl-diaminopimelate desuccinylase-like protein